MIEKQFTLNSVQIFILVLVFLTQILAFVSNLISILCVYHWKRSRLITRPKLLIVNVAISDTALIIDSFLPRYLLVSAVVGSGHPLAAHVIQSVTNYVNALTLYVTSFTMTVIACDRYFAITRVFTNPMDRISTKTMIIVIWTSSLVFSLPFIVTTDVYYYDYRHRSIICLNSQHYLPHLTSNKPFKQSTRLFRLFLQFFVPTVLVVYFTVRIVTELFRKSRRMSVNSNVPRYDITKRLILVLVVFVVRNTAFHLVTIKSTFNFNETVNSSCDISDQYFTYYVIIQITESIYSVIYFWLSSEFRSEFVHLLKYRSFRKRTTSRDPILEMTDSIHGSHSTEH